MPHDIPVHLHHKASLIILAPGASVSYYSEWSLVAFSEEQSNVLCYSCPSCVIRLDIQIQMTFLYGRLQQLCHAWYAPSQSLASLLPCTVEVEPCHFLMGSQAHIVLVMFSLITPSPSSTHQSPPEEPCTGSTSSLQTRACGKTGSLYSDGAPEAGSSGSGLVYLRSFVLTFLSADPGLNWELRALRGNFGACDHQCLENKPLLPFHKVGIFFTLGAKATAGGLWKLDSLVDTRADAPGCRERRWAGSSQSQQ